MTQNPPEAQDLAGGDLASCTVTQLAVFIENRAGRLADVCAAVSATGSNIVGFSIADEEGFGIFRLIVDRPEEALARLREAGFMVKTREVLSVEVPHRPGGLSETLRVFREANLNVEYLYSIAENLIVFLLDQPAAGVAALRRAGIRLRRPKFTAEG